MVKKIFFFIFFMSIASAEEVNDVIITSDIVDIKGQNDQVIFTNNLSVDSGVVLINATKAIYDNKTKVIEITGEPSFLRSLKEENEFNGSALKIIFYDNNKVHLIGNAKMKYENMTISSNKIIFSPNSGFIESKE